MLQRKQPHTPRISRWEKLMLLVLAGKLTMLTSSTRVRLGQVVLLFKPETLLKWHRELVGHKWTFKQGASRGRPALSPDLETLILRLARGNPTWGYGKLEGELGKLGYAIGARRSEMYSSGSASRQLHSVPSRGAAGAHS
jgi:hypothetical protein